MKTNLAENMKKLRKTLNMTQEDLAERINVSPGVISKWERGTSEPELASLVALAEVFKVSVDALIGYSMSGESPEDIAERISMLQKQVRIEEAIELANEALIRYPNNLEVVVESADLFNITKSAGFEENFDRSIELYNRAITLLSQDTKGKYSEAEFKTRIAMSLISQSKYDEAIEVLKANNILGMNDDLLGLVMVYKEQYTEAIQYLSKAFMTAMEKAIRIAVGFINAYEGIDNLDMAMSCADIYDRIAEALTIDHEKPNSLVKISALLNAGAAGISMKAGDRERARRYLLKAYSNATRFDAAPDYGVNNIRFACELDKGAAMYDDTGEITLDTVEGTVKKFESKELYEIWKEIKGENED